MKIIQHFSIQQLQEMRGFPIAKMFIVQCGTQNTQNCKSKNHFLKQKIMSSEHHFILTFLLFLRSHNYRLFYVNFVAYSKVDVSRYILWTSLVIYTYICTLLRFCEIYDLKFTK